MHAFKIILIELNVSNSDTSFSDQFATMNIVGNTDKSRTATLRNCAQCFFLRARVSIARLPSLRKQISNNFVIHAAVGVVVYPARMNFDARASGDGVRAAAVCERR